MKKLLPFLILAALLWNGYQHFSSRPAAKAADADPESAPTAQGFAEVAETRSEQRYTCDGRKRCPQMHSCAEATWFLEHCPGMEMDGDRDGIPCEGQWCGH
jgi:hypothetical protein